MEFSRPFGVGAELTDCLQLHNLLIITTQSVDNNNYFTLRSYLLSI